MTISSSLNAGVSGLASNASRLATIADNIANSSTNGYKRVETDFHSMVISSSRGTYSAGGVRATTNRIVDQPGALLPTSNATDLAVRKRGFLPVSTVASLNNPLNDRPMYLTTTGSFRTDSEGYLVTESGLVLLGWPADGDGSVPTFPRDTSAGLVPVQINSNQYAVEPTTRISLGSNLPADETKSDSTGTTLTSSVEYFDNLGRSQTITFAYTPVVPAAGSPPSNTWQVEITDSASNGDVIGEYEISFSDGRLGGGSIASVSQAAGATGGAYDPASGSFSVSVAGGPIEISVGTIGSSTILTQVADDFAPASISKDGAPVGNMTSIEVDANGFVHATFDFGITRTIYQIPLVDVANPNGLIALDNQTYQPSSKSGSFFLWDAADGPTGDIVAYALEESATDVAGELTDLIQTQRAYSSNAKVIQTVDEMLQETTNIKR